MTLLWKPSIFHVRQVKDLTQSGASANSADLSWPQSLKTELDRQEGVYILQQRK